MRSRIALLALLLVSPAMAQDKPDDAQALEVGRGILERGAGLFDKRDAAAMAATYLETAQIILVKRDSDTDKHVLEIRTGRGEIEKTYVEIFKDRLPEHRARNTLEGARFASPTVLVLWGRFALDVNQGDIVQFVQTRVREGDDWKVATMQLLELPPKND